MDRPRLSISLAQLLPPQHSLGSPIFLGLALSLSQGIPLESHYPQKSGICLLPRAFPWIRILSAYVIISCIGEASRMAFLSWRQRCRVVALIYLLSLFSVEHIVWRYGSLRANYRYTNLRGGELWTGSGSANFVVVPACA